MSAPEPEMVALEIFSVSLPVLDRVTVWVALLPTEILPKSSDVSDNEMVGAVPCPLRDTVFGFPEALCAMDNDADLLPVDVGAKVTVTVWL